MRDLLVMMCGIGVAFAAHGETMHEVAKRAERPAGAPEYGDVCFRYGWVRADGPASVDNAKKAIRAFHSTRVDWFFPGSHTAEADGKYVTPAAQEFIDWCHAKGMKVGGAITTLTADAKWACKKWRHIYLGDPDIPEFCEAAVAWGKAQIDAGVDTLVLDALFSYQDDALQQQFNDRVIDRIKAHKAEFTLAANSGYFIGADYVKRYSFDFHYSDSTFVPDAGDWWAASRAHCKEQSALLAHPHKPMTKAVRRTLIALGYATGAHVIAPWDQFMVHEERLFADPADYADLYGFARALGQRGLLDGYEDAAVGGYDLKETRYGASPPIAVSSGSGKLSVFGRAKPGRADAPVVLHLAESGEPEAATLRLRTDALFGTRNVRCELLTPPAYRAEAHNTAETSGNYAALAEVSTLPPREHGDVLVVDVPPVSPWATLVIGPAVPAPRVIDMATPYVRPDNVPAASDVTMRSLIFRPANDSDPHDTFKALDAFHATRLEWVYPRFQQGEADKIQRVKDSGRTFGGAASAGKGARNTWREDGTADKKYVIIDAAGRPVIQGHKKRWARPPSPGCCNDPVFRQRHLAYLKRCIDAGAETMQRDEPNPNHMFATQGVGCFCPHCMAGFRDFLASTLSKEEFARMGITDVSSFDFRAHSRSRIGARASSGDFDWSDPASMKELRRDDPLNRQFADFQIKATTEFHATMKREMAAYAGRSIPYSCNNTSFQRWDEAYFQVFDFAISELMLPSADPGHIYDRAQKARSLGKVQVFGSPKTLGKKIPDQQLTRLKRQVVATSYASGGLSRVAWDIYQQSGDGMRYFGRPEYFADLYAMVRASHRWLDKYCTAGAFGTRIKDNRYGNQPPIRIEQKEGGDIYAFLRAIPGDKDAPVVIHLVDWSESPVPSVLRLRTDAFFPARSMAISLRTPRPYQAHAHGQAEKRAQDMRKPGERLGPSQAGAYKALVQDIELVPEKLGDYLAVRVPPVTPWGMLLVRPGQRLTASK